MILLVIRNELIPQSKASKRNEEMTIIIYKTFNPQVPLPQFINRNFTDGAHLLLENKSMRRKNPISLRFMTDELPMITMGIFSWQAPPFKERRGSLGNCKLKKYVVSKLSNFTYCYMNYCYVQIEYKEMFIRELVLIHIDITTIHCYRIHFRQLTVSSSYVYKTNKSNLCLYLNSEAKYTQEKYIYFAKNQAELQISITCIYI